MPLRIKTLYAFVQTFLALSTFAMIVTVVFVIGLAVAVNMRVQHEQSAVQTADQMAQILVEPLYTLSNDIVSSIARTYVASGTLSGVQIVSEADGVIVELLPDRPTIFEPLDRIVHRDGMRLGVVRLWFSDRTLVSTIRYIIFISLAVFVGVMLAIVGSLRFLKHRIIYRSLTGVVDGVQKLSSGRYAHRIPETGFSDIDNLITTVNDMAANIQQASATLEEKVLDRTAMLKRSLDDLHLAQEQLLEARKMSAIGTLVEGLSHEINTPLGVAITGTSHLQRLLKSGTIKGEASAVTESSEALELVDSSLHKAVSLLNNLRMAVMNPGLDEAHAFDLSDLIGTIAETLRPGLSSAGITLETGSQSLSINSFEAPFWSIIDELCDNAMQHAFTAGVGGTIRITAGRADGIVRVRYHDDGCGIESEVIPHVCEPFFTTRARSGNTGLGMYTVYALVHYRLNGSVEILSEPRKGTTIDIIIPDQNMVG